MIIGCPQCDTRFVVPSTIFMRGARKLRCSSCKHTWTQEEPLEKSDGIQSFASHIHTSKPKISKDELSLIGKIKRDFTQGYAIIGGAFIVVLIGFFIYQFMTPRLVMGEGLAFDNIMIERDGSNLLIIGAIVNAMDSDRGIPSIEITKLMMGGIKGDSVIVKPEKSILQSGETLPLSIELSDVGTEVLNVSIGFKIDGYEMSQPNIEEQHQNNENHSD